MKKPQPPHWANRLLEIFCAPHLLEEVQGDLEERFQRRTALFGERVARRQYAAEVLSFLRPFALKRRPDEFQNPLYKPTMLRNYFTTALRNLWRDRTTSAISIVGLSVGLGSGILIFLLFSFLFSFDRYHAKAHRTYWVVTDIRHENVVPTDAVPRPLGEVLRRDYPFVETAARVELAFGRTLGVPDGKKGFSRKFEESRNVCFAEPQFFNVFDVEWAQGDPNAALSAPNAVVLSERYAKKYFDEVNPIGRILRLDNRTNLTVTGIVKNLPSNTKLHFDVFISYASLPGVLGNPLLMQRWEGPSTLCFVALREGAPLERLASVLTGIGKKYLSAEDARHFEFHALPLSELNHNPRYGGRAPLPILYALILVGLFLIAAACINFINIATARALKRAKEVGVRKAMGSTRWQLVGQFLLETTLVMLAAVALALLLVELNLPRLNQALAMLNADLSVFQLFRPDSLGWFGGLVLGVILLAGLYPALVMARFRPAVALRGHLTARQVGGTSVRRGLVGVQFFITQLFVLVALVMTAQVRHMQEADLGFRKEAILTVPVTTPDPLKQQTLRERLRQVPGVEAVALGADPPAAFQRGPVPFTFEDRRNPEKFPTTVKVGDDQYVPLFGLNLVAGRNFRSNDSTRREALINQTMLRQLGLRAPAQVLGKRIRLWDAERTIVGVVADFHLGDWQAGIQPVTLLNQTSENHMAALKLAPFNLPATLKAVERVWNGQFPDRVFRASFLDDQVREFYLTEQILLGLIQVFSVIAILIGCLGLYGLVAFMAEVKKGEIGVRKVLGAGLNELLWLFGREFGKLAVLGFLVAAPLGWFLMNGWLQRYASHVSLGWWVFAATFALTVAVTLLTVSYESLKAVFTSPAKSLRSE